MFVYRIPFGKDAGSTESRILFRRCSFRTEKKRCMLQSSKGYFFQVPIREAIQLSLLKFRVTIAFNMDVKHLAALD